MNIQLERLKHRNGRKLIRGPVIYWMNRDQRAHDNWALLYAQQLALDSSSPLVVFFGLVPTFLDATARQYGFMMRGLEELAEEFHHFNIPLVIRSGTPNLELIKLCSELNAGAVVTDFFPLRLPQQWREEAARDLAIAFYEVDAHNIVPCWHASPKQEFAAYTFRPKIKKLLSRFLVDFPKLKKHPFASDFSSAPDFSLLRKSIRADSSVQEITWLRPGEASARAVFADFVKTRLSLYDNCRNNPTLNAQSNLSPYLHFGHISAQRIAWELSQSCPPELTESFLEELIVRRELADNFCYYNPNYDNVLGFPDWARKSIKEHERDPRSYLYSFQELEQGRTHDDLWNAAQIQMVRLGKMHGYMRMYWAKKILEWTPSVEAALESAIRLNDKYELDGRDPNGYCGIAWSIGGVHDRAWFDRPIFGKIRFMSYNGCKSKFDINNYIKSVYSDNLPATEWS